MQQASNKLGYQDHIMFDFLLKKPGNIGGFRQLNSGVSAQSIFTVKRRAQQPGNKATWNIYTHAGCIAENRKLFARISTLSDSCTDLHLTFLALQQLCWSYRKSGRYSSLWSRKAVGRPQKIWSGDEYSGWASLVRPGNEATAGHETSAVSLSGCVINYVLKVKVH